jgi:hypothetical protein
LDFNFSQEEPAVKTNLQDTFKPENLMMEQNRQRVLNDSLLNKFKNEQLLFSEAQLTTVVDIKDIEVMFAEHLTRVYDKGSYNSGV